MIELAFTAAVVLVGFVLTVGSAYMSFKDKKKVFKTQEGSITTTDFNTYKVIFWAAIAGGLLTVGANVKSEIEKRQSQDQKILSDQNAKVLSDSLLNANAALIKSQNLNTQLLLAQQDSTTRIIKTQNKIIDVDDKLFAANVKVHSLQSDMYKQITGGTLPPAIETMALFNSVKFSIENADNYPMQNVRIKYNETENYSMGTLDKNVNNGIVTKDFGPHVKDTTVQLVILYNNRQHSIVNVEIKRDPQSGWLNCTTRYLDDNNKEIFPFASINARLRKQKKSNKPATYQTQNENF